MHPTELDAIAVGAPRSDFIRRVMDPVRGPATDDCSWGFGNDRHGRCVVGHVLVFSALSRAAYASLRQRTANARASKAVTPVVLAVHGVSTAHSLALCLALSVK